MKAYLSSAFASAENLARSRNLSFQCFSALIVFDLIIYLSISTGKAIVKEDKIIALQRILINYAPAIFSGGHIVSPLSVRTSVRPVRNTNGFRAISFERIGELD